MKTTTTTTRGLLVDMAVGSSPIWWRDVPEIPAGNRQFMQPSAILSNRRGLLSDTAD